MSLRPAGLTLTWRPNFRWAGFLAGLLPVLGTAFEALGPAAGLGFAGLCSEVVRGLAGLCAEAVPSFAGLCPGIGGGLAGLCITSQHGLFFNVWLR
jgi:hypothetical protein